MTAFLDTQTEKWVALRGGPPQISLDALITYAMEELAA